MTKVEAYVRRLHAACPGAGRSQSAEFTERVVLIALAIYDLHHNRQRPFRLSRPQFLRILQKRDPGINDSAVRRATDRVVEMGFINRLELPDALAPAQNQPGKAHEYVFSSQTHRALQLTIRDFAAAPSAALFAIQSDQGSSQGSDHRVQRETGQNSDHNDRNFISPLGKDIVVGTGGRKSVRGVLRKMPKHERPKPGEEKPEDWDLPPVEIVEVSESLGGIPIKARTTDGRPLTGSVAGMEALWALEDAARLDAIRPVKPTLVDDSNPFSLKSISKRVGFTVRVTDESREERATRIAQEDAERRAEVERRLKERYENSIASEVETRLFLLTTPEGRATLQSMMPVEVDPTILGPKGRAAVAEAIKTRGAVKVAPSKAEPEAGVDAA